MNIEAVIGKFDIEGSIVSAKPFGSGHINDTYHLANGDQTCPDYLLQRVNHEVFRDVAGMMNNIDLVNKHLHKKRKAKVTTQETLSLIKTKDGKLYSREEDGSCWRIFDFKKGTKAYDRVETTQQAYEGGKAFGLFFKLLSDFPAAQLVDTIPNFHSIMLRLETLKTAMAVHPEGRTSEVRGEIDFVFAVAEQMCRIEQLKIDGQIPVRVTHNDTKLNNVLLDANGRGTCVIDLDTVMPGIVHYDFGDGIRTSTCRAAEDEADLSKIQFDISLYEAFTKGYLEQAGAVLLPVEITYLPLAGALFPYLMGVRFLTDYISNDPYYKVSYPAQNLNRARAQFELCRQVLEKLPELNALTQEIAQLSRRP